MKIKVSELREYIRRHLLSEQAERSIGSEIYVFDFDDTLVKTDSHVRITSKSGEAFSLTPMEYGVYKPQFGDVFDFSDFDDVLKGVPINSVLLKLKIAIQNYGINNVFILTARGNSSPIRKFLNSVGVNDIRIFAIGSSDPLLKAKVISDEVKMRRIKHVVFYDDSLKNVNAVKTLRNTLPGVNIQTIKVG